ncbi:MAG: hypothetical protein M3416_03335, partial [Acidobacteriota bacterium]|nr:hypothetical protein [Acidobacteriota bacterium]
MTVARVNSVRYFMRGSPGRPQGHWITWLFSDLAKGVGDNTGGEILAVGEVGARPSALRSRRPAAALRCPSPGFT